MDKPTNSRETFELELIERAHDLAQDDARARARETRFPMADFEDEAGQLPAEKEPQP